MAAGNELERMVVSLVGDNTDYVQGIDEAAERTVKGAKKITAEATKLANAANGATDKVIGRQRDAAGRYIATGAAATRGMGKAAAATQGAAMANTKYKTSLLGVAAAAHRAAAATEGYGKRAQAAGSKLQGVGLRLGLGVTAPVVALRHSVVNLASDAEEISSKFGVVFKQVGDQASTAAAKLSADFDLSDSLGQKLLGNTGDLLSGFGFSPEDALQMSSAVQTLAGDLASFTNIDGGIERASEALTSGLLGERERMKALGIVISENSSEFKGMVASIQASTGASLMQAKAQATLRLAIQQSKNAIGDYARTRDGYANQERALGQDIRQLGASFGKVLLPQATKMLGVFRKGVAIVNGLSDRHKLLITQVLGVAAVIGPMVLAVGGGLAVFGGLAGAMSTALAVGGGILTFLAGVTAPAWATAAAVGGVVVAVAGLAAYLIGTDGMASAWDYITTRAMAFGQAAIGFIANIGHNSRALVSWLGSNWATLFMDMGRAAFSMTVNVAQNIGVMVKTGIRLLTAFSGWMEGQLTRVFYYVLSDEFSAAIKAGISAAWQGLVTFTGGVVKQFGAMGSAVVTVFQEIPGTVLSILSSFGAAFGSALKSIMAGELPDVGALLEGVATEATAAALKSAAKVSQAYGAAADQVGAAVDDALTQLQTDYAAGKADNNFLNTAGKIIKEGAAQMRGPLEGFESALTELPDLKFASPFTQAAKQVKETTDVVTDQAAAMGDAAGAAVKGPLDGLMGGLDAVDKATKKKKKVKVDTGNADAALRGTAAAYDRIAAAAKRTIAAGKGPAVAAAGPAKRARLDPAAAAKRRTGERKARKAAALAVREGAATARARKIADAGLRRLERPGLLASKRAARLAGKPTDTATAAATVTTPAGATVQAPTSNGQGPTATTAANNKKEADQHAKEMIGLLQAIATNTKQRPSGAEGLQLREAQI